MPNITVAPEIVRYLPTQEFDVQYGELAAARETYESTPRDPQTVPRLARASTRLTAARRAIHQSLAAAADRRVRRE